MHSLSDHEADRVEGRGQSVLIRLTGYARPYIGLILLAVLLSGAFSAGRYARAYLMKPIFDDVVLPSSGLRAATEKLPVPLPSAIPGIIPEAEAPPDFDEAEELARLEAEIENSFMRILIAAVVIVLAMPLLMFSREYTIQWVLGRMDMDMKVDVCGKLLALPLRFHRNRHRGDVMARVMGDVVGAHNALRLIFGDFIEAALMLIGGAAALVFVSWKLSLVMLLAGPGIFGVISLFGRRIRKSARKRQLQFADVTQRLVEMLEGIKVIKAFRAEAHEHEGFARSSAKLFRKAMNVVRNRVLARSLVDMLNNAAGIGVIVLGVYLVLEGRWGLSMGDLAAFAAITTTIYPSVRSLARGWVKLMDAEPSAERFFEVLDSPVEIRDAVDAVDVSRIQHGLRLCELGFSYGREPVLRNVDLNVAAGEVVAIVGRTGAGKTTLTDLLLRFYDPTSGSIELDGVDLRRIRRSTLLDQMAVVTQEPFLFDGTIGENIRYGRPDASEAEFLAASRAAHVDEFVDELPEGYDTEVGAAGMRVSGGQRQRITIARAILRDPAILILDEATSSLDSKSERFVQEAIENLMPGRTVFVVAHRLSTVRRADKIVVLEEGRISQTGTHDELVATVGLYRELVDLQSTTSDAEARLI